MARHATLKVEDGKINQSLEKLVVGLLEKGEVKAVLVPTKQPHGSLVMQTLIHDPKEAASVDPFAPVVPTSSATILAKLTRKNSRDRVAAFLRPCEVKAFHELVKLKQASAEQVLIIGVDCKGRLENRAYIEFASARAGGDSTLEFLQAEKLSNGHDIVVACKACEHPVAENVDLRLEVFGFDPSSEIGLEAVTEAGEAALAAMGLEETSSPSGREKAVEELVKLRRAFRDTLRAEYQDNVSTIDGLMKVISSCVNCYNCRNACPVCYCRECVFATDTFSHDSRQYFGWAEKRGSLRMPTDTLFYHLTRMAHISTLCVGCGQCTTACPNDIPISELFGVVAEGTQKIFGYVPGRSLDEAQPLSTFEEDELFEVTGQVK